MKLVSISYRIMIFALMISLTVEAGMSEFTAKGAKEDEEASSSLGIAEVG